MEAAALFYLAGRAQGAGSDVRAACALTVSDTLSEEETSEGTYLSLDDLERATDTDDPGGAPGRHGRLTRRMSASWRR